MEKCWYCNNPTDFLVGSSKFNHHTKVRQLYGYVCLDCLPKAIKYVMDCCFATKLWPVICNKYKRIIWHGYYDAELQGLHVLSALTDFIQSEMPPNQGLHTDQKDGRENLVV
jgi:hypothetical protein